MSTRLASSAFALALCSLTASGQSLTTRYHDEVVPLRPDASQIVAISTDAAVATDAALDILGVDVDSRRTVGVLDAVLVDVPFGVEPIDHARALRGADEALFTGPAFFDDFGGPLLPTPTLLLRFTAGTERATQDAVVSGVLAEFGGAVVDGPAWAGLPDAWKLELATRDGDGVIALANALSDRLDVRWASPNWLFSGYTDFTPNDTFFSDAWHLENTGQLGGVPDEDIDAPEAWDITLGSADVPVVVIATGVEFGHADLPGVILGEDFVGEASGGDAPTTCDFGGTLVAGVISATTDNGIGVAGIAPDCPLLSARAQSATTACTGAWTAPVTSTVEALAWAAANGARVSCNSSTYGFTLAGIDDAYAATRDAGMIHFAPAGNGSSTVAYPASLPSVVAVTSTTRTGTLTATANTGPGLALAAPGGEIVTTDLTGVDGLSVFTYPTVSGSLVAAPVAAGVAALILSKNPSLSAAKVEQILFASCADKGLPGYDETFGWGTPNAADALSLVPDPQEVTYLKPSNTDAGDRFGSAVAYDQIYLVVGSLLEDSNASGVNGNEASNAATDPGAAYVFRTPDFGSTWQQDAYLKASNTGSGDRFGGAVSVDQSTVVVGARLEDSAAFNGGAAYVFLRQGGFWSETAFLTASNADASDAFGVAVANDDDGVRTIAVGAYREDGGVPGVPGDDSAADAGAVYVFEFDSKSWVELAYVKAASPDPGDEFGTSVALEGDTLVIGAPLEDSDADGIDGDESDDSATDAGAAYVFERIGTTWTQTAYLKAHNSGAGDRFGTRVDIVDDRIIVGAPGEDGSGTDVDPLDDDLAADSGAAYVFRRDGASWVQDAYLKATNTDPGDLFGSSVALTRFRAAVGAIGEASCATGPDGDPSDNSLALSGAVYVFADDALGWFPDGYLKAPNADAGDEFGFAIATTPESERFVVAARYEDGDATGTDGAAFSNAAEDAGSAYVIDIESPWTFLVGTGLAGSNGITPLLSGSGPLIGGADVGLSLSFALPSGTANLVVGLSTLDVPFKGGVLVPSPDVLITGLPIGPSGSLQIVAPWPTGIPSDFTFTFQYWIADPGGPQNFSASNATHGLTP